MVLISVYLILIPACSSYRTKLRTSGPIHHPRIRRDRSCQLVPNCISSKKEMVKFEVSTFNLGGSSRISKVATAQTIDIECLPLDEVFAASNISHVDYLSLDIEGHEAQALKTVNFSAVTIDIITAEGPEVLLKKFPDLLNTHINRGLGLLNAQDAIFTRKGFRFGIEVNGGQVIPALPPKVTHCSKRRSSIVRADYVECIPFNFSKGAITLL